MTTNGLEVSYASLVHADLMIDCVYRGGTNGNAGDDPIARLLKVGNSAGFRYRGSANHPDLIVLYTSMEHNDWPDSLDIATGLLTYYGDNRTPGRELHETPRKGNVILRNLFSAVASGREGRENVPPIFVFSKAGVGRDVQFRGLAIPGSISASLGEDLVAIWRSQGSARFQNYRATFSILDCASISRRWIDDVLSGNPESPHAPGAWIKWRSTGRIDALVAESIDVRGKLDQLPSDQRGTETIERIHHFFNSEVKNPFLFEQCAVDIWRMTESNIGEVNLTRPWRDGGRDAIGTFLLGSGTDKLSVEFALEAKCYGLNNSVGVREMSRLISRLRHRQFGVFITTSYFNSQAYQEVRDDRHPVVLIPAREVVETLARHGLSKPQEVTTWLKTRYRVEDN